MKNKKGFTLIEMMTVLAIIGILTSIVIVSLDKVRSQSRDKKRVGDIKSLQLALENYYNRNSHYPNTLNDLVAPGILPALPVDPSTNSTSSYLYTLVKKYSVAKGGYGSCNYYHLAIPMENNMAEYLDSDADVDSKNGTVAEGGYFTCTSAGILGSDSSNCSSASATSHCYDVMSKY
ncbi:MAG: prepilin-type N-terminal cleavage/methylation domain-containing protein [bacterium]